MGKSIVVENKTTKQRVIEEESLRPEKWYKLLVTFSSEGTVIWLDDEELGREGAIIRKEKDR